METSTIDRWFAVLMSGKFALGKADESSMSADSHMFRFQV